jgi:hypothetical protein
MVGVAIILHLVAGRCERTAGTPHRPWDQTSGGGWRKVRLVIILHLVAGRRKFGTSRRPCESTRSDTDEWSVW